MKPRCPVTGKYKFKHQATAEREADRLALLNWNTKGLDAEMSVYYCPHCQHLHIGTRSSRPIHPWKPALNEYRWLENPRPRTQPRITAGNFK